MRIAMNQIVAGQRSERGLQYDTLRSGLVDRYENDDEFRKRVHDAFLKVRGVIPGQVHSNQIMSTMSKQYANDEFIGEKLMPVVKVGKRSDAYATYDKRERLAFPQDAIAHMGEASELSETRSTDNYSVKDYSLQNSVGKDTLDNQDTAFNEMLDLVESVEEGLAFKREQRIATILQTGANYAGNTSTPGVLWDTATADQISVNVKTARAAIWNGRGKTKIVGFCGREVMDKLSVVMRPLFMYTQDGFASAKQLAAYFELDDLLVGDCRQDTANDGQSASYSRIWGKNFGIVRVAERPNLRSASFGNTFRMTSDPQTQQWFDPRKGVGGAYCHKSGYSEDHKVIAGDTGYLFTGVMA